MTKRQLIRDNEALIKENKRLKAFLDSNSYKRLLFDDMKYSFEKDIINATEFRRYLMTIKGMPIEDEVHPYIRALIAKQKEEGLKPTVLEDRPSRFTSPLSQPKRPNKKDVVK